MNSHRSQVRDPERFAQLVRDIAARHGADSGCAYAEAFRRLEVPQ